MTHNSKPAHAISISQYYPDGCTALSLISFPVTHMGYFPCHTYLKLYLHSSWNDLSSDLMSPVRSIVVYVGSKPDVGSFSGRIRGQLEPIILDAPACHSLQAFNPKPLCMGVFRSLYWLQTVVYVGLWCLFQHDVEIIVRGIL